MNSVFISCIVALAFFCGCGGAATNKPATQPFSPLDQVDIRNVAQPASCELLGQKRMGIALIGECSGVVGLSLFGLDTVWTMNVNVLGGPVPEDSLVNDAFCRNIHGRPIQKELAESIYVASLNLGAERVLRKSSRAELVLFPQITLYLPKNGRRLIESKSFGSIQLKLSSPEYVSLVNSIPRLLISYYGQCNDELPGCKVAKEILESFRDGGTGRLGCMGK